MTDDHEICGSTDTDSGEPCQTPAHLCQWHTDGPTPDGGRPSKLADVRDDVLAAAEEGLTYEGIARVAGVGVSTLRDWRNDHPDFSAALERARAKAERDLLEDASAEFILERSYDYVKTERREIDADHTHEIANIPTDDQLDDLAVDLDEWR